jgi:pectin methylesterase-like acyl-CoA thioesterase/lysophospholipase L1-like esterase
MLTRRSVLAAAAATAAATAVGTGAATGTAYAAPRGRHVVHVRPPGSVQAAVDAAGAGWTVVIHPGTYRETVTVPASKAGLTLLGATGDPRDVVIVYDNANGTRRPDGSGTYGTAGSATFTSAAPGLTVRGLTIANDWLRADHPDITGTQAVAVYATGDRTFFDHVRLLAHQDTLYADTTAPDTWARHYYRDCHVEGDVDFVFGRATAVFDRCELRTLNRTDLAAPPYGFVFAPSTVRDNPRGFLAVRCRITSGAPDAAYKLARPWVPTSNPTAWPMLTVRDSWMGTGIDAAAPYTNMRDAYPWQTMRFAEYANLGPGAAVTDPAQRPQLTGAEAAEHTPEAYLGDWAPQHTPRSLPAPDAAGRPFTVYVAGDSTASVYATDTEPRTGWGQALPVFTTRRVTVDDRALSGASSKSYADAGLLDHILDRLRPGDRLLVSFGHNDEKTTDPARGTDPYTTFQAHLRLYLDGARQRGAHPVLVTPVERRRFDADGNAYASHGDYPAATRDLARAEGVPLIDLTALSMTLWQRLGPEGTKDCFLWLDPGVHPNYPAGVSDNTHFKAHGAIEVARLVARALEAERLLPRGALYGLGRQVHDEEVEWPPELPVL